MATNAQISLSVQIKNGNLNYQKSVVMRSTVTGSFGPAPGAFTATTNGTDVDLSQFAVAGICIITNLDSVNKVRVGIWDNDTHQFYPLLQIQPGNSVVLELANDIGDQYNGTGTAMTDLNNRLRIKAENHPCAVVVEAFAV